MAAYQAPPSTGFSRQEYWNGLPLPSPVRFNIQYENFGTGIQRQHDTWETVHALSPDLSFKLTPTLDNGKLVNKLIYVLQFVFLWNQRDFKTNLTGLLWIRASLVAQLVKNPPAMQEIWVWSLVWEDQGFPGGLEGKASTCNEGDPGSIPESGRSPGEGNGNPLQYSCLENPIDGGAWEAAVHGVVKSWTWLSRFTSLHFWEDLEKGKATHSSILAWRIPWIVHGVAKSRTQLSDFHFSLLHFILLWISFQHILIEYYLQQMVEIVWFIWIVCFYFFLMLTKIFVLPSWILSFLSQATIKMATVKESTCKAGDPGSIPGSRRFTGEGNGNLLQHSCMGNSMDRGASWALKSMGLQKSDMTEWLTHTHMVSVWLPSWLSGKKSACKTGEVGSIPGFGRYPEEGNDNPLQYSCLGNSMDRRAWQATVHGVTVTKSQTRFSN